MMKKYIIYITLIIIGMFVGYVIRPENKIEDVLCKTETSDVELVSYIDATYDLKLLY